MYQPDASKSLHAEQTHGKQRQHHLWRLALPGSRPPAGRHRQLWHSVRLCFWLYPRLQRLPGAVSRSQPSPEPGFAFPSPGCPPAELSPTGKPGFLPQLWQQVEVMAGISAIGNATSWHVRLQSHDPRGQSRVCTRFQLKQGRKSSMVVGLMGSGEHCEKARGVLWLVYPAG